MTDSRAKGATYMNHIARRFSLWFDPETEGKRMDQLPFRQRETHQQPIDGNWRRKGDLWVHPDLCFPFSVECKKQEVWNLEGCMNEKWPVWLWWDQATEQAEDDEGDTLPMLVFSRNYQPDFVLLDTVTARCLMLDDPCPTHYPVIHIAHPSRGRFVMATLDDLFEVDTSILEEIEV